MYEVECGHTSSIFPPPAPPEEGSFKGIICLFGLSTFSLPLPP